jgi:hypothetical protein
MLLIPMMAMLASVPTCVPIAGAQQVLADGRVRWLIVGEQHGTNETPAAFIDLVCIAATKRTVAVAVEQPVTQQAAIDAFIASDGSAAARAAFLKSSIWTSSFKDGRSSQAIFGMFNSLRQLRAAGRITRVIAFQPVNRANGPAGYEQAMADELAQRSSPEVLTVALVGNVHAMRKPVSFSGPAYMPMAGLLRRSQTTTLDARPNGGSQWACMSMTDCGAQIMQAGTWHSRGVVLGGEASPAYSGAFNLGVPATASLPQE